MQTKDIKIRHLTNELSLNRADEKAENTKQILEEIDKLDKMLCKKIDFSLENHDLIDEVKELKTLNNLQ